MTRAIAFGGVRARVSATGLAVAALTGCTGVPPHASPPALLDAATLNLAGPVVPVRTPQWWRGLNDRQLDAILDAALAGSPTLDTALARIGAARATLAETGAASDPQVVLDASASRQRLSGRAAIPPPFAGSTRWVANAQVGLDWTLDFFGRQRALVRQASAAARAAELDAASARLAIIASVAAAYVDLSRAYGLGDVARELVASRQRSLALARTRVRTGLASDFELRAGETLLAEAEQAVVRADAGRILAIHALAALAGRGTDFYAGVTRPRFSLDQIAAVPAALPADLLGRRPDILAARARVEAALGGQAAARADFYPNVNLRALVGLSSVGLGNFVSADARTYGGGPALSLPLFDGGRLRARHEAARAQVAFAVADYDDVVLRAVRDASDALSRIAAGDADLAQQRRILAGLDATIRLDRTRVSTGLGTQLDLLETGTRVLAARQAEADLVAEAARRRVQLMIALGGDFLPPADAEPTR